MRALVVIVYGKLVFVANAAAKTDSPTKLARSVSTPPTRVAVFCCEAVSSRTSAAALSMSVSSFAIGET